MASLAFFVAPLIGRPNAPTKPDTQNRREMIASVIAMIGVLLAALQLLAGTFDLISRLLGPLGNVLPILLLLVLALGAVGAWSVLRHASVAAHRRRATLLLLLMLLGTVGWGGWLAYDKLRPPSGTIVIVASFEPCKTCPERDYGNLIQTRVQQEVNRLKLPNIEIRRVRETFPDSAAARARGADYKATLVIWGSYDTEFLLPNLELLRLPASLSRGFVNPEELAIGTFRMASGSENVPFIALVALGLTRFAEGDYTAALSLYDAALPLLGDATNTPNAQVACFYKALALYANEEDWTSVEANLKKAVAIKPNWADAHYLLALAYLSACKPDGSNALDLALSESITTTQQRADANSYWLRGTVQTQLRRWADAADSFAQSLKYKDDPEVRASLVDAYRRIGRNDLAEQEAKKVAATSSSTTDEIAVLQAKANTLYAQGKYDDAALSYQKAISRVVELKRPPRAQSSLYLNLATAASFALALGNSYYVLGDYASAAVAYQKYASLAPNDAVAHATLGFLYVRLNRNDEAIASARRALQLNAQLADAHYVLRLAFKGKGDKAQAIAEFEQVTQSSTATPELKRAAEQELQQLKS